MDMDTTAASASTRCVVFPIYDIHFRPYIDHDIELILLYDCHENEFRPRLICGDAKL